MEYEKAGRMIDNKDYLILDEFVKGLKFYELSKIESIMNKNEEIYNIIIKGNEKSNGWFNYKIKDKLIIEKIPEHINQKRIYTFLIAKYKLYLLKRDFKNASKWFEECIKYIKNTIKGNRFISGGVFSSILIHQICENGIKPLIESDIKDTLLLKKVYKESKQLAQNIKPPHIYLEENYLTSLLIYNKISFPFNFSSQNFFLALKFYLKNKFTFYNFLFSFNAYSYKEIYDFKELFLDREKLDSLFKFSPDLYSQILKKRVNYVNEKAKKSILEIPEMNFLVDRILNTYIELQNFINKLEFK